MGVGQVDPAFRELVSILKTELDRTHERELYWRQKAEEGTQIEAVIGSLDRLLSEMLLLAVKPKDDEDRQTLKHHAEDMLGAAQKILALLETETDTPQP